jgi:hypothetical protein
MAGVVPDGYLSVREALRVLTMIRCAGLEMSAAVIEARAKGAKASYDRAEMEASAQFFWSQVDAKKLAVRAEHPSTGSLLRIDPSLLNVPFLRKYSVSDLSYLRSTHPLSTLLFQRFGRSFKTVQLLIAEGELQRVAKAVRRTRKRQQAHPGSAKPVGRPSKVTEAKPAIRNIVDGKQWTGAESLKKLTHILSRRPYNLRISEDTAARALDELFEKTRDRRFQRMRKASRMPTWKGRERPVLTDIV